MRTGRIVGGLAVAGCVVYGAAAFYASDFVAELVFRNRLSKVVGPQYDSTMNSISCGKIDYEADWRKIYFVCELPGSFDCKDGTMYMGFWYGRHRFFPESLQGQMNRKCPSISMR